MIMHTPKIDLYPHNQETYDKIIEMWETSNRVAVIQATGTGKTYLMLRCMADFEPSKKVVLAPSNYILDQLLSKANGNLPNTELLTYAKLAFMTKEEIADLNPSLIVLDEFHRCGADKWELGVDMLIKMFPKAKILGTSATPIRYLDNARDMSDELFEGNIAVNLSLSDAIVKGILPMPKYISALYTFDEEINNLQAKIDNSNHDEETKNEFLKEVDALKNKLNKSKGIPQILNKYLTDIGGKFIVFCKDKAHLIEMEDTVVEWFSNAKIGKNVDKYRVLNKESENNKEMIAFRGNNNTKNIRLLFSIDMLNEGIHIDDVTGVILLRPTISPIIFYQQIGRAIQVGNANNPVIFDFVNNFKNIRVNTFIEDLKESREKETAIRNKLGVDGAVPEFTIIDEMKEPMGFFLEIGNQINPDWETSFQELVKYRDKYNSLIVDKSNKKLRSWTRNQKTNYKSGDLSDERISKLNSISFPWNTIEENWSKMFDNLVDFKNNNNNFLIGGDNVKLSHWVQNQRTDYKNGEMSPERISRFNEINLPWDYYERIWDENYESLKEKLLNNLKIDLKMMTWCSTQRALYKENKLSKEKISKFNEINFSFSPIEDGWMLKYEELRKYYKEFGNCLVSFKLVYNGILLGRWVAKQREYYKNDHKLSKEQIDLLNEVNFEWEVEIGHKQKASWLKSYYELKMYKEIHGDLSIDYLSSIGKWVSSQRGFAKIGRLTKEKIDMLNQIGFIWDTHELAWEDKFSELASYKEKYGDCLVRIRKKEGNDPLGNWVGMMRGYYKNNRLSQYQIDKLNKIGFVWSLKKKEDKPNETTTD